MNVDDENPFASPQAGSDEPRKFEVVHRGGVVTVVELPPLAPCPKCNGTRAEPAPYSWWRGRRAPVAAQHVLCPDCSCEYNGENGKPYPPAMSPWPLFIIAVVLAALYFLFHVFIIVAGF